ncbi:MAG: NeuD/PglB/VioB family sugar acetyltransferase [Candidatus Omnitrophica bacterium]|nr:NeuD/PglB/VioB family sugar acetyltransferase [Candidatus Omnitrophota bacterium]
MKIIIVGAGSTAQSIASILRCDRNFQVVGFTDKDKSTKGKKIFGLDVIGPHVVLKDIFKEGIRGAVVAIGYDNNIREKYFHELKDIGYEMINVIHPSAIIDHSVSLTEGVIIGPGCIISPMVKIERNTILESGVIIGANTQIADNVYIGIGCCVSGSSFIKRNAFLSAGCSVAPFVTIGKNAKIGPGASVSKDVPDEVRKR